MRENTLSKAIIIFIIAGVVLATLFSCSTVKRKGKSTEDIRTEQTVKEEIITTTERSIDTLVKVPGDSVQLQVAVPQEQDLDTVINSESGRTKVRVKYSAKSQRLTVATITDGKAVPVQLKEKVTSTSHRDTKQTEERRTEEKTKEVEREGLPWYVWLLAGAFCFLWLFVKLRME